MTKSSKFRLQPSSIGVLFVHWTEGRRSKRISTKSKDPVIATAFLRAWESSWLEAAREAARAKTTCADLWAVYTQEHVRKNCADQHQHVWAWRRLEERFGTLRPAEVTSALVDEHLAARLPTKPTSVFVELRLMTASWNFGVKRRLVASTDVPTPFELGIPGPPPPRTRWFLEEEVDRLFAAARALRCGTRLSRVERFMALALLTGSRRTALLQLRWSQVDFETRVLHLNPDGRAQTSKHRPSVPINDALLELLHRAYRERQNDYVLDHPRRMPDALAAVARRAGVKGVSAHVFRHTAATWMARSGVPLWDIAKVLGNSVTQVERTYAHHNPEDLRASVESISGRRSFPSHQNEAMRETSA